MTKKSQPDPLPPPPQSSDEEEEESGSEEEESGSESDDSPPNPKQPQKTQTPTQSDDSGSDESDDDSQANISTVIIKPISSKPMKNDNKQNPDAKTAKKDEPAKKRANSDEGEKDAKKAKKTDEEDAKKPVLFQRLFSENDELVILKSMIEYKNENGIHGEITDMAGFYEIVSRLLPVDFTRPQLVDKIRRLKKKFRNNLGRELKQKKGKSISFSKSNEREGYELSKTIWGSGASTSTPNGVADKEVLMMDGGNGMDVGRFVKYGGSGNGPVLVEEIVKAGMELVDDTKRKEWEARWKTLKLQELELYAKRTDLVKEHVAIVIEGVKSSAV